MDLFEQSWRKLEDDHLPTIALEAPGWLLPIERKLLWWIGARYWKGVGEIVDAGAFCGASAVAFASGVRASANIAAAQSIRSDRQHSLSGSRQGPVVSFDKFMNVDNFEREFIEEAFGARLLSGDSFLDFYLKAVGPYLDLVRVEAGDFLEKQWNGKPIEVLFLDLCKTRALNAHAVREFFPHLIPGHSLVIQQDFMGVWLPHINWTMEYLSEYFEIVDAECGPSRVYLLTKAIPQNLIKDIVSGCLSLDERLNLLDDLREKSLSTMSPHLAMLADGMKLQELVLEGELDRHDQLWDQFLKDHSIPNDAAASHFLGEAWVNKSIPNWIPQQLLTVRDLRLEADKDHDYQSELKPEAANLESAWLETVHVRNAKLVANRNKILPLLPKGGVVAEIGVAYGDFSQLILDIVEPSRFFAFDLFTFEQYPDVWGRPPSERLGDLTHLEFYKNRFADLVASGHVQIKQGQSWEMMSALPDACFDLIYIDGNHSLEGVQKDTEVAIRKLKPNGMLIYNDYTNFSDQGQAYGIVPVVNDLCVNHGWEMLYFALEPHMFCDVALRRR